MGRRIFNFLWTHGHHPRQKCFTTVGQTAARRSQGGKCSRNSPNCTSRSQGEIGFTLFEGFYKPFIAYPGLQDCLRTAFVSYGIECEKLSRG